MDAGIRYLLSPPMTMRTMCGATRPTNPMIPEKLIMAATLNATITISRVRKLSTSSPRLDALSSPRARRFSLLLQASMTMEEPRTKTNGMSSSLQVVPVNVPICHR